MPLFFDQNKGPEGQGAEIITCIKVQMELVALHVFSVGKFSWHVAVVYRWIDPIICGLNAKAYLILPSSVALRNKCCSNATKLAGNELKRRALNRRNGREENFFVSHSPSSRDVFKTRTAAGGSVFFSLVLVLDFSSARLNLKYYGWLVQVKARQK